MMLLLTLVACVWSRPVAQCDTGTPPPPPDEVHTVAPG